MNVKSYVKEKFYIFLLGLLVSAIQTAFFYASGSNIDTIMFFIVLLWVMILFSMYIDYSRKVKFYREIHQTIQMLDKKSLLHEMIKQPEFLEGRILYDILETLNKYINDQVNEQIIREREYQEYIELWVHEIKTPLAAGKLIVANSEGDKMKVLDGELNKIDNYIEQALYYARSTSVEKDYLVKYLSLSAMVSEVVKKHREMFLYKKIKVELHDLDVMIYSDAKWLGFILHQLLDNALKYSEINGTIEIFAEKEKENIVLFLKDTGIGIPTQDMKRVFQRGFTGENGREYAKATGMGLYLSKKLCEKLYIGIDLQSVLGEGTCVKLTFPKSSMVGFE